LLKIGPVRSEIISSFFKKKSNIGKTYTHVGNNTSLQMPRGKIMKATADMPIGNVANSSAI